MRIFPRSIFFLCARNMQTFYLIIFTALGGLLALFAAAGWGSYKEKKLPATGVLFRWFVTGVLASGLGSYAWIFGGGGDPAALLEKVSESLEVKEVVETLTSAVSSVGETATKTAEAAVEAAEETLTIGMPSF